MTPLCWVRLVAPPCQLRNLTDTFTVLETNREPTGGQLGPTGGQLGANWGPTAGGQQGANWGPTGGQQTVNVIKYHIRHAMYWCMQASLCSASAQQSEQQDLRWAVYTVVLSDTGSRHAGSPSRTTAVTVNLKTPRGSNPEQCGIGDDGLQARLQMCMAVHRQNSNNLC